MRAGGGKGKGNSFERWACKALSMWITRGKRDDVLWRSAMSGGRATVRAKQGRKRGHFAGDICAVHPAAVMFADTFFIECKAYKDLQLHRLVAFNQGKLADFWNIAKEQAQEYSKSPMLIFRQNHLPTMMGVTWGGIQQIEPMIEENSLLPYTLAVFHKLDLLILNFEEFLHTKATYK